MISDWSMIRILTGLGMYLSAVSICSLVNYHQDLEALDSESSSSSFPVRYGQIVPLGMD